MYTIYRQIPSPKKGWRDPHFGEELGVYETLEEALEAFKKAPKRSILVDAGCWPVRIK